jgi:hypothetical protein
MLFVAFFAALGQAKINSVKRPCLTQRRYDAKKQIFEVGMPKAGDE